MICYLVDSNGVVLERVGGVRRVVDSHELLIEVSTGDLTRRPIDGALRPASAAELDAARDCLLLGTA